jgi:thiamine-phosphate pyrophosphorylase
MRKVDYTVYYVTDESLSLGRATIDIVRLALAGGAGIIQVREKGKSARDLVTLVREIHKLCVEFSAACIVNDSIEIAKECGIDGVHLGKSDDPIGYARSVLGPDAIIGASVSDPAEAIIAERAGATYVAASPVFATPSKPDATRPVGLDGLRRISDAVAIPTVAIGGITRDNAADIARHGAAGIAVISALSKAANVTEATRDLYTIFNKGKVSYE